MSDPVLQLHDTVLRRGSFVSAPLSLTLHRQEKSLLIGPNGCGKTSLLQTIAGLLPAHRGQVHRVGAIAFSAGQWTNFPEWTVWELLHDGLADEAEAALQFWQLPAVAHKRLASLSLGFQQRVSLALATFSGADLVLLDEPANGLDPMQTETLQQWLQQATPSAVLLVSHQLRDIPATVSRAILLGENGVQFDGPRGELPAPWQR